MSENTAQLRKVKLRAEPILEINLNDNGGKLRFFTLQELEEWVQHEFNFFKWIGQYAAYNEINPVWQNIQQFQANAREILKNAELHTAPAFGGQLLLISSLIEQTYCKTGKILASQSVNATFVADYRSKNEAAAVYAYAYLTRQSITLNNPNAMQGALDAYLFEKGINDNLISIESKALAELRNQVQRGFTKDANDLNVLLKKTEQLLNQNQSWHKDQIQHFENIQSERQLQLATELDRHEQMMANDRQEAMEELKKIQQTFSVGLAAEAPVTHWENKRKKHAQYAKRYVAATTLIILAIVAAFGYIIFPWLTEGLTPDKSPAYWKLLVTFLAASFSFWVIRILVTRLILNQIDRHDDAEERTTLVTTFLALLRTESALDEKDKSVILPIIFRAANTASTKDEGPSVSVVEEALKNILKK